MRNFLLNRNRELPAGNGFLIIMTNETTAKERFGRIMPVPLAVLVITALLFFKLASVGTACVPDDSETLITVKNGLSVTSQAYGKLSEEQLQELIDEYGEDAHIIIYEVGE